MLLNALNISSTDYSGWNDGGLDSRRRHNMKIFDYDGKRNITGHDLKRARRDRKLTQDELAATLQAEGIIIDRDSISRIETGRRFVADYELKAFYEMFGNDFTSEF
jgi:DNA-binding XRE family transcriptional regulator